MSTPNPSLPVATRRRLLVAMTSALAASAVRAAPAAAKREPTFYDNFKDVPLRDQDNQPVKPERWLGRLVLVNHVYTGCSTVCPVQTRALAELQRGLPAALRPRVRLLSVSLDPQNDTPAALREFAVRMGADLKGWTFATGRPADIERLSASLRLFRNGSDVRKPEDHNTAVWLLDKRGAVRMRYSGNPVDVPRLQRELAELDRLEPSAAG